MPRGKLAFINEAIRQGVALEDGDGMASAYIFFIIVLLKNICSCTHSLSLSSAY
jgi:hypothetical protein